MLWCCLRVRSLFLYCVPKHFVVPHRRAHSERPILFSKRFIACLRRNEGLVALRCFDAFAQGRSSWTCVASMSVSPVDSFLRCKSLKTIKIIVLLDFLRFSHVMFAFFS